MKSQKGQSGTKIDKQMAKDLQTCYTALENFLIHKYNGTFENST